MNINDIICEHITNKWLQPWLDGGKSQTAFGIEHDIDESTVRKIKSKKEYRIPVETLERICKARGLSLAEFFKEIGY